MVNLKGKAVFLSGPMSGARFYNVAGFAEAHAKLKVAGVHEVYNPAIEYLDTTARESVAPHEFWMRRCIQELTKPERTNSIFENDMSAHYGALVSLPGWQESEGARTERMVAEACGIPCYELDEVV